MNLNFELTIRRVGGPGELEPGEDFVDVAGEVELLAGEVAALRKVGLFDYPPGVKSGHVHLAHGSADEAEVAI